MGVREEGRGVWMKEFGDGSELPTTIDAEQTNWLNSSCDMNGNRQWFAQ